MFGKLFIIINVFHISFCINVFFRGIHLNRNIILTDNGLFFDQILDHYDMSVTKTWKQQYFVNDAFYKPGGPVFLMIGGEGPANPIWMTNGQWVNWGKQFGALLLMLEHRYYGKSYPTPDMSEMQYLKSEQALQDVAYFIQSISIQRNLTGTKWITFGGSYPGSLSAWARLKFPHLIYGAVASSAPLNALIDFTGYLRVVQDSLGTNSQMCVDAVHSAITLMDQTLNNNHKLLQSTFNLCTDVNPSADKDVSTFYQDVIGFIMDVVQYNKDNRAFEGAVGTNITIDTICNDYMLNTAYGNPMQRLGEFARMIMAVNQINCLDISYNNQIADLKKTDWVNNSQARQWFWQTCTEFGFFQTTDDPQSPFGNKIPLSYYTDQCIDVFGAQYNETLTRRAIIQTNVNYGALAYAATRVILPNGSIDPWHALGLLKSSDVSVVPVFIVGAAHCADMYPSMSNDMATVLAARQQIQQQLVAWLTSR